ncbi:MFS transporter [Ponticoccus sp. SC2-23]|uniref:MFS transporter n=1 Tax=Alexandriicola marinus TaxID=2081710 RepID=UPI000FD83043|nr:MFS transporter [Alexandriicola marinus]MBM1219611.1 MFS transporter [Ponticoccus sp. SC6-9]MBM1223317.1 MFS transporter [Ponticoccus sp. SC6-15]MBM1229424.1 MFS transporter [Ponticoccus sp. SC6-38]MBM1232283.1 MFS transporter [Ponticoccus sp. SC6-45]MBM1237767.1 MFS transporter [Ponticoccus sp. SC6-49]MBM1241294.1 MFS transporter [Ponticoccus sp. SC2-64]MBM1245807.1 MFS transporter [Ponticoccus sp. SC6-42]MBM1250285.1 MFS transporter [Ponticoccus sp. SC6-33]MBM1255776.1 MFS transporter
MSLSLKEKAGWGLADMGIVVFVVVKQLLVLAFLTSILGVPVGIAGAVTTFVLIFDVITDPLIGYLSDRTKSRWGRRAPWMAVGAVILAAAMVALFTVPSGLSQTGNIGWVTGFFVLATIGFTMVAIPYGAMAGEMTRDPRERSAMTGWRMAFASIGILIGGAVIPGLAAGMGYAWAALIVSPLIVGAVWLSLWLTRETPRVSQPSSLAPLLMARMVIGNRPFMILVVLYGVMTMAIALITAGLPFAAIYLIVDSGSTALSGAAAALTTLSLLFAAFVVGSILSQAVWVLISRLMTKTGALVLGLALYIALLWLLYQNLPSVDVTLIAGLFVLAGMTNGAYQQIPWAMYPDLMDVTRAETGEAIEGAFSALWLFGQKVANALAPLVLGAILALWGWVETTEGRIDQTEEALRALHLSVTLIPAGILALAILGLVALYLPALRRARRHAAA